MEPVTDESASSASSRLWPSTRTSSRPCSLSSSVLFSSCLKLSPSCLTLLSTPQIFHQAFEGCGLGARLANLRLPSQWEWAPYIAAISYAVVTPIGIAIGLGVRSSLSLDAAGGAAATGILDAISSGILIYTATVELMAHEFVFVSAEPPDLFPFLPAC